MALQTMEAVPVHLGSEITIGVAAHNGAPISQLALDCLLSATQGDFELILVDDASSDQTMEVFQAAAAEHANTKIIRFPTNREYVESVNSILSLAGGGGGTVFFVSNDYLVTPAWFRGLLRRFEQDSSIGILTGTSSYCDNLNDPSRNLINPSFIFADTVELFRFAEGVYSAFGDRALLDDPYLVGDAFAVTRSVLDRIGTFDTGFVGYVADQDFAIRCKSAGFRVAIDQSAFGYHIRDGNIYCLDREAQEQRKTARHHRVQKAFNHLVDKYQLNDIVGHRETGGPLPAAVFLRAIAEAAKRVAADQRYVGPRDYSEFLVSMKAETL